MIKNTVTLALKLEQPVTVNGYSPDNTTALIVHKHHLHNGYWVISHKCGLSVIPGIKTRAIALLIASELGKLTDWHNITKDNVMEWYNTGDNKSLMSALRSASMFDTIEGAQGAIERMYAQVKNDDDKYYINWQILC